MSSDAGLGAEAPVTRKGFVYRITTSIDNAMRKLFFRVGYFVAGRPLIMILASIVVTVATLAGMLRFRTESRAQKLWVPQNTVALDNYEYVTQRYGQDVRLSSIVFLGKAENMNLATRQGMLECLKVTEEGAKVVGPAVGSSDTNVTIATNCIKTKDTKNRTICTTISPFSVFYEPDNVALIEGGELQVNFYESVRRNLMTLSDAQVRSKLENKPHISPSGTPFTMDELLGGVEGSGASYFVRSIRFTQITKNNAVFANGNLVDEANDELERVWSEKLLVEGATFGTSAIRWQVQSTYSEEDALSGALSGDLPLFSIGFILLTIYVILYLGDFHVVRSRQLLGIGGLANAGLALGVTFGLGSAFGMFYGPVHQILPLLIIGIGVDDVFVMTRSLDEVNSNEKFKDKSPRTRIALAVSNAGSAITVTSITNTIVFLLGSISRLPALRFFALWAAIGVVFDWAFTLSFYTALLTLDTRRQTSKRRDCCPCFKVSADRDPTTENNWFRRPPGGFTRFFKNYFGPFITNNIVRSVILFLFGALFCVCIWGTSKLYLKFDFSFFFPAGSDQRNYQDIVDEYYKIGLPAPIYLSDTDISTAENQRKYLKLCDPTNGVIAKNEYIRKGSVDCWYQVFREFESVTGNNVIEPSSFYAKLKAFLQTPRGFRYNRDIIFENGKFDSARFNTAKAYAPSNTVEINALTSIRKSADSVGFGMDGQGNPRAFTFFFQDLFTEQYRALPKEIGLSLSLASLAVAVVCFQLVGHPLVAAVCVLVVGMIIIDVLGFTYFSGVNLNSISVITIVIATGIAVDYVVHIGRAFLEQVGTRKERAIKSLGALGPPVFYAGFSTFLAIIVLAFATSYIFNVLFLGFLALIIIGLAHGLIFGPVLLSFIGPPSFFATEEEKEQTEMSLIKSFAAEGDLADVKPEQTATTEV